MSSVNTDFRDGSVRTTGGAFTKVLSPVSRFAADGSRSEDKWRVLTRLAIFFDRLFGTSSDGGQ
jgi:type I restriction enzyme, R subunit